MIRGKVIDENLHPFPGANIMSDDTVTLVKCESDGHFEVAVPTKTKSLIIAAVGMDWKLITLPDSCNNLEIVLLYRGTYDFMSPRKIDRDRRKRFKTLTQLHRLACEQGIFQKVQPCFENKFIPLFQKLKEIRRARRKMMGTYGLNI